MRLHGGYFKKVELLFFVKTYTAKSICNSTCKFVQNISYFLGVGQQKTGQERIHWTSVTNSLSICKSIN